MQYGTIIIGKYYRAKAVMNANTIRDLEDAFSKLRGALLMDGYDAEEARAILDIVAQRAIDAVCK